MKKFIVLIITILTISITPTVSAGTIVGGDATGSNDRGLLTGITNECANTGDCGICDVVTVFNNVILGLLGIVGSLCLAAFIYAGFKIIISSGDSGKIGEARDIFKNAAIGLGLVFFSVTIVNFALNIIVGSATPNTSINYAQPAKLFGYSWLDICKDYNVKK